MAFKGGELPANTKVCVLRWMETMYKLATGRMNEDTPIQGTWMQDWFDDPAHYSAVGGLLRHGHKGPGNISHHAIGSCFHIIQDCYAVGYTRREPMNSDD